MGFTLNLYALENWLKISFEFDVKGPMLNGKIPIIVNSSNYYFIRKSVLVCVCVLNPEARKVYVIYKIMKRMKHVKQYLNI